MNLLQQEELKEAADELEEWKPINLEHPSTMEQIVLYHSNLILGKVLRYQGHFHTALECLKRSLYLAEGKDLFDEVRHDLLCNLGDVYIELNDPISAKQLLQAELNRLGNRGKGASTKSRLPKPTPAEAS